MPDDVIEASRPPPPASRACTRAAGLTAAVERGSDLLADAEEHRQRRTAELDRLSECLQDVEGRLRSSPAPTVNRSAG
jgi:hypothetical protein